jgi:hypothetical protein
VLNCDMPRNAPRPHMRKQLVNGLLACTRCKLLKPTSDFNRGPLAVGFSTLCRACNKLKMRAWRRRYPANYRRAHLRRTFGIDIGHYDTMLRAQGGVCGICHCPPNGKPFHVDHEHTSNRIRGLLCDNCNMAIGLLQDDPEITRRAAAYME